MAAVYLLRVQPVIRAPAKLCGQLIVLDVAAPDKHLKPVVSDKAQRSLSLCLVNFGVLPVLDKPCRDKLAADVRNILLTLRALQQLKYAVEIVKLLFTLRGELRKVLLRGLHLAVFLEERCRVLLRRLQRVKLNAHGRAVRFVIVLAFKATISPADAVEVRLYKLRAAAERFPVIRAAQLLKLCGKLSLLPVAHGADGLCQVMAAAALLF